jgi:hypothetical protein
MNESNIVRIIWLSDIHFRAVYEEKALINFFEKKKADAKGDLSKIRRFEEEYQRKKEKLPVIEKFIACFINSIKICIEEIKKEGASIDYVIISGDLAFSGLDDDYSLLENKIIGVIKKILGTGTKFVVVPGNHDVFWDETEFLGKFLDKVEDMTEEELQKEFWNMRKNFLRKRKDSFDLAFKHYTKYFQTSILPTLKKEQTFYEYDGDGLCGMIIDKEKNLVLNLLNSAWFALGQKFDNLLIKGFMENYSLIEKYVQEGEKDKFEKIVENLILLKTAAEEYGQQVLGESIIEQDKIIEKLDEHSNYFVLTIFHHPMNWLQYSSKYATDNVENDKLFLNRLLKRTELLLTGHEHVPSSSMVEKINNEVFHLKGGMLMQDDLFKELEGESRFSILEIDTERFLYTEKIYSYNSKKEEWEFNEKYLTKNEEIRKKQPTLNGEKEVLLSKKFLNANVIRKVLKKYFIEDSKFDSIIEDTAAKNFKVYLLKKEEKLYETIMVPTNKNFFSETLLGSNEFHCFDPIVKLSSHYGRSPTICIVTPDFLVDEELTKLYSGLRENLTAFDVYYQIVKKADFIFNTARHNFFERFEKIKRGKKNPKKLIINGINFEEIVDVQFSSQIIPFWVIQKYD